LDFKNINQKSGGSLKLFINSFKDNRETGATPVRTRRCVRGQNPQILLSVIGYPLLEN
jgi:hypothetical protein